MTILKFFPNVLYPIVNELFSFHYGRIQINQSIGRCENAIYLTLSYESNAIISTLQMDWKKTTKKANIIIRGRIDLGGLIINLETKAHK